MNKSDNGFDNQSHGRYDNLKYDTFRSGEFNKDIMDDLTLFPG